MTGWAQVQRPARQHVDRGADRLRSLVRRELDALARHQDHAPDARSLSSEIETPTETCPPLVGRARRHLAGSRPRPARRRRRRSAAAGRRRPASRRQIQPFPTSTPVAGPAAAGGRRRPARPRPAGPAAHQPPPPPPTFTPAATPTTPPTWTPLPSPTVTNTPTITPFPTFLPRITPTLAWPTPGPSAYFLSRYMATALDPTLTAQRRRGPARPRRRLARHRPERLPRPGARAGRAARDRRRPPTASTRWSTLAPGEYEVLLPDYTQRAGQGDPGRGRQRDDRRLAGGQPQPGRADAAGRAARPRCRRRTATPVPANLIQRPAASPARPPPAQIEILDIGARAVEQLVNWFLTGVAVVSLIAVVDDRADATAPLERVPGRRARQPGRGVRAAPATTSGSRSPTSWRGGTGWRSAAGAAGRRRRWPAARCAARASC